MATRMFNTSYDAEALVDYNLQQGRAMQDAGFRSRFDYSTGRLVWEPTKPVQPVRVETSYGTGQGWNSVVSSPLHVETPAERAEREVRDRRQRDLPVMTGISPEEYDRREAGSERIRRGLELLMEDDPFTATARDAVLIARQPNAGLATRALGYTTAGAMAALKSAEQFSMGKTTLHKGAKPGTYAEAPRGPGHGLGPRGATAGYVAEKTGKPVAEVLREHGTKGKDLGAAGRRRAAQVDAQRTAAKRAKAESQWQAERAANEDEARGTADPRELLKPDAKSKARMPTENDLKFLQAVTAQIHKAATDPERGQRPVRPEDALKSSPPGDAEAWDYDPPATVPMIAPGVPESWLGAVSHTDMDQTLTRRWLTAARIADAKGQRLRNPVRNLRPEDHKLVEAYVRDLLRNPHVDVPPQLISDLARPGVFTDKAFDSLKRAIMKRPDQGEMVRKGLRMSLSPWGLKAELETAPEKGAEFAKLAEDIMRLRPADVAENGPIYSAIAKRAPELTADQRAALAVHPDKYVRFQIAKQPDLPKDLVDRLAADPDMYVAQAAIRSPHATEAQVNDVLDKALDVFRRPMLGDSAPTTQDRTAASQAVRSVLLDPRVPADDVIYTLGRPEVRDNSMDLLFPSGSAQGRVSFPDLLLRTGRFSPEDKGRVAAHLLNLPGINYSRANLQWMSGQLGLFLTDTGDAIAANTQKQRDPAAVDARSRMARSMASELDSIVNGSGPAEPATGKLLNLVRADPRFGLVQDKGATRGPADSNVLRDRLASAIERGDQFAVQMLEHDLVGSKELSRQEVRDVTARALWAERARREQTGGEIRPGDSSSKLGWFRDETADSLVRPTMQTTSLDTPPVVMWMHPGLGKSTRAAVDGNLIDFDAVRGGRLEQMIQGAGYTDYGMPGPNGERFDKLAWRRAHPGVIERFDSQLLDEVLADPDSRGHIILTSVLSHLRDRGSDMSLVIDMPTDVAVKRIMDRDGKTFEDASAWKRDVDAVMSRFKTDRRYMSTDAYLDDLYASPEFESLLERAEIPASIVDTGSLGVNGMFMSGTAGPSEYAFARPSFPRRFTHGHGYGSVAREFVQLPFGELADGEVTYHQADGGTGTLKWELNGGLGDIRNRLPFWRPNVHERGFRSMTSNGEAAILATVRPEDVPVITDRFRQHVQTGGTAPVADPSVLDQFMVYQTSRMGRRLPPRFSLSMALSGLNVAGGSGDVKAGIGKGTPVWSASPVDRYKAMIALRRLADRFGETEPYEFPTDFVDDRSHRNLPTNEFKTRAMPPDTWNASMRRIIVPPGYADTPQGQFLQRRYPHIELVPMDPHDKAGSFRRLSDEAAMEYRQAAKAGDADRFAQSRSFLTGDDAPDSLFGIPIAKDRKSWTAEDRRFFAAHPEAGGYYQMDGDAGPDVHAVHGAGRGGDAVSNFLATDEVPETLFGIPVAAGRESWTDADVRFFRKHPEAGGYYDMGDGEATERPPMQAAVGAGDVDDEDYEDDEIKFVLNGNLKTEGRPRYLFRDDDGKVKGYGTQLSVVRQDTDGTWVAIPTIIDGREPLPDDAAFEHYKRTGEFFHRGKTMAEAKAGADAAHERSQAQDLAWWNNYIADHLNDGTLSETDEEMQKTVNDPGFLRWAAGQEKGAYERKPGDSDAELRIERRRRAILDGRIEPNAIDLKTLPLKDLNRARKARRNYINKRRADMGPGGLKADVNGGKTRKKIPPIVKGPLHYGPPPPPSRGKYPGIANNPGNVEKHERRSDKTLFKGEIAGGVRPKRFANFSDPVDGLTAAATVLSRRAAGLAEKGLPFTIENYVPGYAPKSENDVEGYINNLSKYSGFARNAALDTGNAEDMAKLLKNVVRFESGVPNSEWFTDDEYRRAALAMQEGAVNR